ncbi:MAG: WbqC family protein, partial [Nitrososphaera sp.]|nr:WbqC family protein [Nitrososphaera sp.]
VTRLVDLCRQAGATAYLSGPSAKSYLDVNAFSEAGIQLEWMDYSGYPQYEQVFPPFAHEVSILDLLFNVGPKFRHFLKSFSRTS